MSAHKNRARSIVVVEKGITTAAVLSTNYCAVDAKTTLFFHHTTDPARKHDLFRGSSLVLQAKLLAHDIIVLEFVLVNIDFWSRARLFLLFKIRSRKIVARNR